MNYIYEARSLVKNPHFPRITVRIADFLMSDDITHYSFVGLASMGGESKIWIPKNFILKNPTRLREIVFHEILHAVYHVKHIPQSILMSSNLTSKSRSNEEITKLFQSHIKYPDEKTWLKWYNKNK